MDKQTLYRVIIVVFVAILIGSTLAIFFIHPSTGYSGKNEKINATRGLTTWNLTLQTYQPYLVVSTGCFNRTTLLHLPGVIRVVPSKGAYAVALDSHANMTSLFIRLSKRGCRVLARAVLQFPRTYGNYTVRGSAEIVSLQPIYHVGDKIPVQIDYYAIPSQKVVYPLSFHISTTTRKLRGKAVFRKLLSEQCLYVPKTNSSSSPQVQRIVKHSLFNCSTYGTVKNVTYRYLVAIHTIFNQTINTTLSTIQPYKMGTPYPCMFVTQYVYPFTDIWDIELISTQKNTTSD